MSAARLPAGSEVQDRPEPPQRRAVAALILGACCIGLGPIFPKLAFDLDRHAQGAQHGAALGIIATAFWRMALAAPLLWLFAARVEKHAPPLSRHDRLWLLTPGLAFAADMATWHKSFEYTTLANTTLLSNFATVIVSLVGWLFWRERLGYGFGVGIGTALGGAALLLGVDFTLGKDPIKGDALSFATAMFYAIYLILVKLLRARFSTVRVMAWTTTVCAPCLLLVVASTGEGLMAHSAASWTALLALALLPQICGQGLITYAMAHLPAGFATVSLLVQPVVAAVLSWIVFAQALSPLQIAGGVLVLAGIAVAQRSSVQAMS